ncbi:P-loop NTPase domain-containing protein [Rhizobium etli bv. mimosae str. Mim1]|nr:P-loop NTPase domain-containing protein [Rhizobium etli bv. mimosae str. Mim1]
MNRLILISGCSPGGKSTLLVDLGHRGHGIGEEPGRRIVKQELEGDGTALPWVDMAAFARRAIEMAISTTRPSHGSRAGRFSIVG